MTASADKESAAEPSTPSASPPRKRLWLALLLSVAYVIWMAYLLSVALFG